MTSLVPPLLEGGRRGGDAGAGATTTTRRTPRTTAKIGDFAQRVYNMIENCQQSRPDICTWVETDEDRRIAGVESRIVFSGFLVRDVHALVHGYFRTYEFANRNTGQPISFNSFQRQLNNYGFSVRSPDGRVKVVRHEEGLLLRGRVDLLRRIKKTYHTGVIRVAPASGNARAVVGTAVPAATTKKTTTPRAPRTIVKTGYFAQRLYNMIEECQEFRPDICSWVETEEDRRIAGLEAGDVVSGFLVRNVQALVDECFKAYEFVNRNTAQPTTFISFQRQLNKYGFSVRSPDGCIKVVQHEGGLFLRGRIDLLSRIRKIHKSSATAAAAHDHAHMPAISIEVEPLEVEHLEVDLLEVDPLEVDPLEVNPLELDPLEVDPLELDPLEVDPLELDPLEQTEEDEDDILREFKRIFDSSRIEEEEEENEGSLKLLFKTMEAGNCW